MTEWSPPRVPRSWLLVGTALWLAWFAYSVVVITQILLGLLPAVVFLLLYAVWRFLAAFEAIADATQRLAAERERRED